MASAEAEAPPTDEVTIVEEPSADNVDVGRTILRPRRTLLGGFLIYFACFGFMTGFGFFQTYYSTERLSSSSQALIALIGSCQLGLMYLVGPVVGVLYDSYGPKLLYAVGGAGAVVSCLCLSFTQPHQLWQHVLSQGIAFGLTVPFGTSTALVSVSEHCKNRRALALGVLASGSSLGGVCFPIMYSQLVPRIGFSWASRLTAGLFLVCYGVAIAITKGRTANQTRRPRRRGLLDFAGYTDLRYATLATALLLGNLGLYVPYNFIEAFADHYGPGAELNTYLVPLINGSSILGRIGGGLIADKIGPLNVLYPMTSIAGVLCLSLWLLAKQTALVVTFACLYGICSGVYISIMPAIVARISPANQLGARLGAFFSVGAVGIFTGAPIGGALIKGGTTIGFQALIIYAGSCILAGGGCLFVARAMCSRNMAAKW